ncbi:MAG: hypothetical protein DCO96_04840 [Fluviicola sp. XM-24bin1]|nr:MAG: hypothetical protein DCO96_04840 [Fluviicola sp. XM-24bin1]
MKEKRNIEQLFQKAASTPVHTSFDEAKETFTASLARRNASQWKILRGKHWIIMITLLFSAAVAGILWFGSNTDTQAHQNINSLTENSPQARQKKKIEPRKSDSENVMTFEQLEAMNPALLDSFIPMSPLKRSVFLFEPNITQVVQFNGDYLSHESFIYDLASDRRSQADSVEIPTLTEDEISANEKYKRKMMKALAKRHKDHYAYIPSGSTAYKGEEYSVQAFYMQVNEVSNLQYRTFLNDLLIQERYEEYQKAYPQEHQWTDQLEGDHEVMENLYFTHPAYDNYPVVNVTREAAEMYCAWLTLETSKSKYVDDVMFLNDLRLPQRLEWTYAASGGNSENVYPWGGPFTKNAQGSYLANFAPDSTRLQADGAFHTSKTGTYFPNEFGLYNISGNVAEMVYGTSEFTSRTDLISFKKEPGTAGGGWLDTAESLKIEGDDPYDGITHGHPNIGFRVVMSFIKSQP